tara:strand:+ start:1350 stop:1640 length:291 start_codon:yes stop_codon:yes gene_type:complete
MLLTGPHDDGVAALRIASDDPLVALISDLSPSGVLFVAELLEDQSVPFLSLKGNRRGKSVPGKPCVSRFTTNGGSDASAAAIGETVGTSSSSFSGN